MVKQITLGVEDDGVNGIKQLILSKENQCNAVYGADGRLINTTGSLEGLLQVSILKIIKRYW